MAPESFAGPLKAEFITAAYLHAYGAAFLCLCMCMWIWLCVFFCIFVCVTLAVCTPDAQGCYCVATYQMVEGDISVGFLLAE